MAALEQLTFLYLKACTIEGKTDRTVESYGETLRQFQGAVRELGLPENMEAFGAGPCLFSSWTVCGAAE